MNSQFYKKIVLEAPMGYALHKMEYDQKGKPCDYVFLEVNKTFEMLTGLNSEDILGKPVSAVLKGIEQADFDWIGFYGEVALTGEKKEFTQYYEGMDKYYKVSVFSLEKDTFITLFVDVSSEKKQLDELDSFFQISLDLLRIVDGNGKIIKVNDEWEQVLGYPLSTLKDQYIFDFIHPEDREHSKEVFEKVKEGQLLTSFVNRYRAADGTYKFIEWRARAYGDKIFSAARDITIELQNQKDLIYQKEQFELAIRGSNDGIWDIDLEKNKVYYSPQLMMQLGYDDQAFNSDPDFLQGLINPEHVERVMDAYKRYLMKDSPVYDEEFQVRHKQGGYRWIRARGAALWHENGKAYRIAGSHTDITDRKEMEESLLQAKLAAETANRMKSRFLANMSHEIRSPMNGVMGYLELLSMSELSLEQSEYVDRAKSASQILLYLINDILDLSKMEAGKLVIENRPVKLRTILLDVIESFKPKMIEKELEFEFNWSKDLPVEIYGDPIRLKQVLHNFIDNAVKFTKKGKISIGMHTLNHTNEKVHIAFKVCDTGIGIEEKAMERLFKPFVQADGSTTRRYGGTGLGLAITHELAKLMNGEITVESQLGLGSTFSLELTFGWIPHSSLCSVIDFETPNRCRINEMNDSCRRSLEEGVQAVMVNSNEDFSFEGLVSQADAPILLVDDSEMNQELLAKVLKTKQYHCDIVSNGHEALIALAASSYAVILMDCQMPIMDGYECTRHIRAIEGDEKHTPIIAMTADAMTGDKEKCIAAGMDDYISKPIQFTTLFDLIQKYSNVKPPKRHKMNLIKEGILRFVHENQLDDLDSKDLVDVYMRNFPKKLTALEKAIKTQEFKAIKEISHQIKGTMGTVGIDTVWKVAESIETAAINEDIESCEKEWELLKRLID